MSVGMALPDGQRTFEATRPRLKNVDALRRRRGR